MVSTAQAIRASLFATATIATFYGGFVRGADKHLHQMPALPANYSLQWSGEHELELRAKQRLRLLRDLSTSVSCIPLRCGRACPHLSNDLHHDRRIVAAVAASSQLQCCGAVGYIALFGIAVETGVVMAVYLHEALEHKLQSGKALTNAEEAAAIEGAVQRLRPNS